MNQPAASSATCSGAPGSSNRRVAPGMTACSFSPVSCCRAWRFRSRTASSPPPTMSSVGARTQASCGPARSGRPSRETTAAAGARGRRQPPAMPRLRRARAEVAQRDTAGGGIPVQPASDAGQPRRQQPHVEHAGAAEFLLGREQIGLQRAQARPVQCGGERTGCRGLRRPLPLPWAKMTTPVARSGMARCPASSKPPAVKVISRSKAGGSGAAAAAVSVAPPVAPLPSVRAAALFGGSPLQQHDGLFVSHIIGHGGLPGSAVPYSKPVPGPYQGAKVLRGPPHPVTTVLPSRQARLRGKHR